MKIFLAILITAIIIAILSVGSTYYLVKQNFDSERQKLETEITVLKNQADNSGSGDTIQSIEKARQSDLDLAEAVVTKFLNAKKTRDLAQAEPYMTKDLQKNFTEESFSGVSSPSMGRFVLGQSEYLESADLYQVKAKIYENLNGDEVGYAENTYLLVKDGTSFLVNEIKDGKFISS